jgi:NodT family efflux transporter outer membrane factor (OMF) lipoprotein
MARSHLCAIFLALLVGGCTPLDEYIQNGFKVGPNYQRPPAPLASTWIDAKNPRVKSEAADYSSWWRVFHDPVLDDLIKTAYAQNVNLRVAGTRVLEARAQRAIAVGSLFPQQQAASGSFNHVETSKNVANPAPRPFFDNWANGFSASWEVDFWGRFRRTIESTDDIVESSVDDYDNVMVTLISDVASAYVQYRVFQQQIIYTKQNVELQRGLLKIATNQWKSGQKGELPVVQSSSLLEQLESLIPVQEIGLRQANNQLCVLLGIPPTELADKLGTSPIPHSPAEVVVGIPADLIRRRPDVRSAERQIAAQNAQIGVADAAFYPAFFLNGNIGVEAKDFAKLFNQGSMTGQIGPAFQWNILNYGRILNNVRFQDFKTQELVAAYQQKVLTAAQEVENGIITYLNSQREDDHLAESVKQATRAVKLTSDQLNAGAIDFTPVFVAAQFLAQDQIQFAQSQGDIALGLIGIYRALGGGWEFRLSPEAAQIDGAAGSAGSSNCAKAAPTPMENPPASKKIVSEEVASMPTEELGTAFRRRSTINRHTGSAPAGN